jgi:hypothetical protein
MGKNRLYLLAGVLVVLVLVAYFLTKSDKRSSTGDVTEKIYEFDSAAVDRIEITQDGKKMTITKTGNEWKMTEPMEYPVNQEFVGAALSDLKNYRILSLVSENPENKDDFGFSDSAKVTFSVYQGGNLVGTLDIGKVPNAPNQTYIKAADSDKIYLAINFLRNNFARPNIESWRNLKIVSIPSNSVNSIEYTTGGSSYKLTRDSTGSFFVDGAPADSSVVSQVLNILQDFNTQTFKDTTLGAQTQFTSRVRINHNDTYTDLNFLKQGDSTSVNYMLKIPGNNAVFYFNEALANNVLKSKSELLKK